MQQTKKNSREISEKRKEIENKKKKCLYITSSYMRIKIKEDNELHKKNVSQKGKRQRHKTIRGKMMDMEDIDR